MRRKALAFRYRTLWDDFPADVIADLPISNDSCPLAVVSDWCGFEEAPVTLQGLELAPDTEEP